MNWQLPWHPQMLAEECPITFECSATVSKVLAREAETLLPLEDKHGGATGPPKSEAVKHEKARARAVGK